MSNVKLAINSHFHTQLFTNYGGHDSGNKVIGHQLTPLVVDNNVIMAREILFLQEKQDELLRQLHQEIHQLKTENCELKFQLYAILKAPNPKEKAELKTEDEDETGKEMMQIIGNNAEIEVSKNDAPGPGDQSSLAALDPIDVASVLDDANQRQPSQNVAASRASLEKNASASRKSGNIATGGESRRLSAPRSRVHGPENMKQEKNCNLYSEWKPAATASKPDSVEKYDKYFKKAKNQASRASIPNITTSNYGLVPSGVPRSSSASSKSTLANRHNSLCTLPPNYKDNVATLPPLVPTRTLNQSTGSKSPSLMAEKSTSVKPWSISQHGQKFNPSTMTKQKLVEQTRRQSVNSEKRLGQP